MGIICPPGWDRVNWSAKIWISLTYLLNVVDSFSLEQLSVHCTALDIQSSRIEKMLLFVNYVHDWLRWRNAYAFLGHLGLAFLLALLQHPLTFLFSLTYETKFRNFCHRKVCLCTSSNDCWIISSRDLIFGKKARSIFCWIQNSNLSISIKLQLKLHVYLQIAPCAHVF